MSELTFESVNKEIESVDLVQLESSMNDDTLGITSKICEVWSKISSILRLISNLPLIPDLRPSQEHPAQDPRWPPDGRHKNGQH